MAFRNFSTKLLLCAAAGAASVPFGAASRAQSYVEHVWREHGDWTFYEDRRALHRVLVNALPRSREARIACVSEFLGDDPKKMGVADFDRPAAERILERPDYACFAMKWNCARSDAPTSVMLYLNVARHDGEAVTAPGHFSFYARFGKDEERAIFVDAPKRGPLNAPDASAVLDAFSFRVGDAKSPIVLYLSFMAMPAFTRALAGHDQLVLRVPPGRDASGRPDVVDVVHAGRSAAFSLTGTQAAFGDIARACRW